MPKKEIQAAIKKSYQNLHAQLDGFIPRRGQNFLVSEIAKTLAGRYHKKNRVLVAEAGTGIGKSLAYLMGAVPFAQFSQQKIVISTATVALQEQLMDKDLPLYRRLNEVPFEFRLVKGRQRYCCAEKLAIAADTQSSGDPQMAMFSHKPTAKDKDLLKRLYEAYQAQKWDGDRDAWPTPIPQEIWQTIVSDKHSCHNGVAVHRDCPFQKARQDLDKANVIIANHSLVMADIELGGGVILPEPEQCIYIFDEAHHLPHIARDHNAAAASLKGAIAWLETLNKSATKIATAGDIKKTNRFLDQLISNIQEIIPSLKEVTNYCSSLGFEEDNYRFEHGELPEWLFEQAKELKETTKKAEQGLGKIIDLISERIKEGQVASRIVEPILAEAGFFMQRLENLAKVWALMAQKNNDKGAPLARWVDKTLEAKKEDFIINVSPLEIGWQLDSKLWSRCAGAILVSATMRALNKFDYFARAAGISMKPEMGAQFYSLSSPFDYKNQAVIEIPNLEFEPSHPKFSDYLIEILPKYIAENQANLVLFSSYWQMNQVADALAKDFQKKKWHLQIQGKKSRSEILKQHKAYCQMQKTSILFGTGSFSEGLDLPGSLLTNLIITKIPFAVPTSPIERAHAEYIESSGGNPFMQIAVPEASKKLIQSVGRLLRKEQDTGKIVLLDRRVITKRYGKALLDSLPPFARKIDY